MIPNQEKPPPTPEMVPVRAFWLALLSSFSVYFIPIIGPHAIFFIWESLWQHFRSFSKNPAWSLTELGVALLLQAAAFALFYWFWRRRSALRLVALPVAGFFAVVLVQYVFFVLIPSRFMIEKESAQETGSWPEACRLIDAQLTTARLPRRMPRDGWTEAWVGDSKGRDWMVRMPGCERIAANLPQPTIRPGGGVEFMIGVVQAVPGGLALVQRQETGAGKITWLLLNVPAGTLTQLITPEIKKYASPYLSDDGSHTVWVMEVLDSAPPVRSLVHLLPAASEGQDTVLDLTPFGPASYEAVGYDAKTGEVLLWVSIQDKLIVVGRDGQQRPGPALPPGVKPQSHTMILSEHGAVAWDAYKEDDNYVIAWALDTGTGFRKIPKGSSITAVAADPGGRYIAVSAATSLNIGNTKDTVFVVRTSDGQEVFRRFLPTYNRTGVVFLGREYFAYSDMGTTHVLRIE